MGVKKKNLQIRLSIGLQHSWQSEQLHFWSLQSSWNILMLQHNIDSILFSLVILFLTSVKLSSNSSTMILSWIHTGHGCREPKAWRPWPLAAICSTTVVFGLSSRRCSFERQFLVFKFILLHFLWEKMLFHSTEMIANLSPTAQTEESSGSFKSSFLFFYDVNFN